MQKFPETFPHPFSKAYWKCAASEMKKTRVLVFAALMIALRVALKPLGIQIVPYLRIEIAFFINAFGAMVFGPVVAILAAAVSDTLGCILFPTGVYFFPFIFIEIAGSLIFALFLYRSELTVGRVVLSRADAWINPPKPQDNPFRSMLTIMRCVFDLFWLTWKTRRETRRQRAVLNASQEDGSV